MSVTDVDDVANDVDIKVAVVTRCRSGVRGRARTQWARKFGCGVGPAVAAGEFHTEIETRKGYRRDQRLINLEITVLVQSLKSSNVELG